ncbi:hypothetical protein V2J09_004174 [Rumex salicifolius]
METEEDDGGGGGAGSSSTAVAAATVCCQVEDCTADLSEAKRYHRRHKVCEFHAKAPLVILSGLPQRFCQQCSKFEEVAEFDDTKRSCRRRLAGHNKRRRRASADPNQTQTSNS